MANVMLKYLKFAQILNRRLSFSSVKYPGQYLYRSYTNSKFGKSYATAAYNLAVNEETGVRNNQRNYAESSSNGKDIESIDAELAKIDSLIRRNGRTQMKNIQKVFSSITSKEMTSNLHGLYLLRSCKHCIDEPPSKRIKMVNDIWNRYQELGIEFDVRHYNAMLDVHVKNHLDFDPVEMLASMEDLKIEPNKGTYMLIMKKYCQDGNISGASEILEYMKEKQISADEKVFNYLIEAHINNNDIAGAKEMVEVMRSSNLEPTADTHALLACSYAATGDKDKMMSHLRECKGVDNVKQCLKVIEALACSGNHQHIDEVLSSIQRIEWHQQELINAAVELIHKNFDDVAFKLALAASTPDYKEGVNIFVKQLIKVGRETSKIMQYCEHIRNENVNQNIYLVASRAFCDLGNLSDSLEVLKKLRELGHFLAPKLFWPLFSSVKEQEPSKGCWFILRSMTELGVLCDYNTYTEVVYPTLGVPRPNEVIQGIKQTGQGLETAAAALFDYYCTLGEVDYAVQLTEKVPVTIRDRLDVDNIVRMYKDISMESTPKYYKILKYIFLEDSDFAAKCDVQGRLLAEIILQKKRLLEIILDKFEDLVFSERTLKTCERELSIRNPPMLAFLKKVKVLNAERRSLTKQENLSIEDEDKHISRLRAENISCRSFLINRIQHHIKAKNIGRVQELLTVFDELQMEYTPLILSNVFSLWCIATDIEKAKETLDKLNTHFPNFQIDLPKALDYVTLLIKYEKFDESYETLKSFLKNPPIFSNKDSLVRSLRRFNMTISNSENTEFVKKMQSLLLPLSDELGLKKSLLDPSVHIHLLRNDFKSALEEFRNIVNIHRVPACLNLFLKKCINANEKDILQRVIDLTTSCVGKSHALLELAVAFIETYRTENAAKVIDSLGSETDPKVLNDICIKLGQKNKFNELKSLIHITKSLSHVDRESLYCNAFKALAGRNDFQKALELFEKMKEEIAEPGSETMNLLQDLFKKNNQPVPLSILSESSSEINLLGMEATKTFLAHLEAGDSDAALKELSSLKKGYIRTLQTKTLTDLVDLCLQQDCVRELALNVHTMSYIFENASDVLKPILEKYSKEGDVGKFSLLLNFMPDFSLMNINFNYHFCKAYINSGKYENLLSHLEERTALKNKLFSTAAFEELFKIPEFEERVFNLALKYLDSDFNLPMSVVWAHYFSKGNFEKAEEIQKKFPLSIERVDKIIFTSIKQNENVDLAKKYVELIKTVNVRSRMKERAYGAALDLLVYKGMYDEAADLVVDSEKQNLQLHKYYVSSLVTLKTNLVKENKSVPFSIPSDTASGSDSD